MQNGAEISLDLDKRPSCETVRIGQDDEIVQLLNANKLVKG